MHKYINKILVVFLVFFTFFACENFNNNEIDHKKMITQVLNENPEIVLNILKKNELKVLNIVEKGVQLRQEQSRLRYYQNKSKNPFKPDLRDAHLLYGKKDAKITIVEYSDFQCSHCKDGAAIVSQLVKKYPNKIKVYFKQVPNKKISRIASRYFEAIARQNMDQARKFYYLAFKNNKKIAKQKEKALDEIIDKLIIDQAQFARALSDYKLEEKINKDAKEFSDFGFSGTPLFLINGIPLEGVYPVKEYEKIIELIEKDNKNSKAKKNK